jgi:enoyl-CoA hydratase
MDMVLTGREVGVGEALDIGLANRHAAAGDSLEAAKLLAREIAAFPQACMRADRASLMGQWGLSETDALRAEISGGIDVIKSGETQAGATRFKSGTGRHGKF